MIGSGGAGKTTVARVIAARTGLPLVHLDSLYWRAGWEPTPRGEWESTVSALLREPTWVMDGNYGGTLDERLAACDTVIFLDFPRWICLWRLIRRRIRYAGRSRPDLPDGCPERLSREFVRWVWTYPTRRRQAILDKLATLEEVKRVVVLRSVAAVNDFLSTLPARALS